VTSANGRAARQGSPAVAVVVAVLVAIGPAGVPLRSTRPFAARRLRLPQQAADLAATPRRIAAVTCWYRAPIAVLDRPFIDMTVCSGRPRSRSTVAAVWRAPCSRRSGPTVPRAISSYSATIARVRRREGAGAVHRPPRHATRARATRNRRGHRRQPRRVRPSREEITTVVRASEGVCVGLSSCAVAVDFSDPVRVFCPFGATADPVPTRGEQAAPSGAAKNRWVDSVVVLRLDTDHRL
jgi:hypothetical protein